MSQFVSNKSCDICGDIEKGLVELRIGRTNHYICYKCMHILAYDIRDFVLYNYNDDSVKELFPDEYDNIKKSDRNYAEFILRNLGEKISI